LGILPWAAAGRFLGEALAETPLLLLPRRFLREGGRVGDGRERWRQGGRRRRAWVATWGRLVGLPFLGASCGRRDRGCHGECLWHLRLTAL